MKSPNTMEPWILYALLTAVFTGITAVLIKPAMEGLDPKSAMIARTIAFFVCMMIIALLMPGSVHFQKMGTKAYVLLTLSGITGAVSWVFYFRALHTGPVSYVSAIDKGSIVITVLLSFIFLKEVMSPRLILGCLLVLSGMLVLSWK